MVRPSFSLDTVAHDTVTRDSVVKITTHDTITKHDTTAIVKDYFATRSYSLDLGDELDSELDIDVTTNEIDTFELTNPITDRTESNGSVDVYAGVNLTDQLQVAPAIHVSYNRNLFTGSYNLSNRAKTIGYARKIW